MPLPMQAKLLRVLEEGEVERVGGEKPVNVDVRVVVATHRDLEARVREEKFRQDLFHRIYVFPLVLPPLRERREDIPTLIEHFSGASKCAERMEAGSIFCGRSGGAAVALLAGQCARVAQHGGAFDAACDGWPGRFCDRGGRDPEYCSLGGFPPLFHFSSGPLAGRVDAFERETILAELKRSHSNVSLAAKVLGLERSHLYKKAEHLGIDLRALRREQESTPE